MVKMLRSAALQRSCVANCAEQRSSWKPEPRFADQHSSTTSFFLHGCYLFKIPQEVRASANLEKSDVDTPHPTPCTLHRVPSEYCLRTSRRVTWPTPMRQRRRAAATPANPAPITTTRLQQPTRLVSKSTICRRKVDCVDFFAFRLPFRIFPPRPKIESGTSQIKSGTSTQVTVDVSEPTSQPPRACTHPSMCSKRSGMRRERESEREIDKDKERERDSIERSVASATTYHLKPLQGYLAPQNTPTPLGPP